MEKDSKATEPFYRHEHLIIIDNGGKKSFIPVTGEAKGLDMLEAIKTDLKNGQVRGPVHFALVKVVRAEQYPNPYLK